MMAPQIGQKAWQDYVKTLNSGMLLLLHPTLTGDWDTDKDEYIKYWTNNPIKKPVMTDEVKAHFFCETPESKCTMNYCNDNGCQSRKRIMVDSPITPEHYGGSGNPYEAIKVIQAWELGFPLGNVLKYIRRSGKKENTTALQDLLKAKKYLDYEIEKLEQCKKP